MSLVPLTFLYHQNVSSEIPIVQSLQRNPPYARQESKDVNTMPYFTLKPDIEVGDLLTSVSILISITAMIISWYNDRRLRQKELADRVRSAAAETLAKLDRWAEISSSLDERAQPIYVETSDMLQKDFNVHVARDYLWRKLNEIYNAIRSDIRDEELENAYSSLYAYYPAMYDNFHSLLDELKEEEKKLFEIYIEETQKDVLKCENSKESYTSADLGNVLRQSGGNYNRVLKMRLKALFKPIKDMLFNLVSQSDKILAYGHFEGSGRKVDKK